VVSLDHTRRVVMYNHCISISISMSFWRFLRFIGAAIIKGNSELWGDADLYRVHEYGMDSAVHDF